MPLDVFFDVAVMHHIPLRCLEKALPLPKVVGNVVAAHTEVTVIFGNPEVEQDGVFVIAWISMDI